MLLYRERKAPISVHLMTATTWRYVTVHYICWKMWSVADKREEGKFGGEWCSKFKMTTRNKYAVARGKLLIKTSIGMSKAFLAAIPRPSTYQQQAAVWSSECVVVCPVKSMSSTTTSQTIGGGPSHLATRGKMGIATPWPAAPHLSRCNLALAEVGRSWGAPESVAVCSASSPGGGEDVWWCPVLRCLPLSDGSSGAVKMLSLALPLTKMEGCFSSRHVQAGSAYNPPTWTNVNSPYLASCNHGCFYTDMKILLMLAGSRSSLQF